jgi:uncharacterized protein (DUF58 family)
MTEPTSSASTQLLPENVRRRLDPLMLVARGVRVGRMKGERRSSKRGTSIEFADYRNYTPGDDLRKLDWNVYARLERPYVKLLEDEEDLAVHVLLDISASMDWPAAEDATRTPNPHNKLLYAQRLAAALGYIALKTGDRLMLHALNDRGANLFGPTRGKGQTVGLLRFAQGLHAAGITDLNIALHEFSIRERRAGLVIVISDGFSPSGISDGLKHLQSKGHDVVFVQVLSPDEVTPPMAGDLRLIDVETGNAQEVTIDANMRTIYQQRLENWLDSLRDECARRGVHYLMVQTDVPYEEVLLYELRRLGVIK